MSSKKNPLPFDTRGGRIVLSRFMLNHPVYSSLTPHQKVLITLMHEQWRNDRPVAFGRQEAEKKIPCSKETAKKALAALHAKGFISLANDYKYSSSTGGKTREWVLNWMPYKGNPPTHEWEFYKKNEG